MFHKALLKSLNVLLLLIMISVFITRLILKSLNDEVKFMGGTVCQNLLGGKKILFLVQHKLMISTDECFFYNFVFH